MVERTLLVDNKTLSYEGLFSLKELYRIIDKWVYDRGYDKSEPKNFEHVYPTGKQVELELWPWRKFTDYQKMLFKIHILITNMKDVEVEIDGLKKKMNQGKLILTLNAYNESDYEGKWESNGFFVFLRTIFDKYVFAVHQGRYDQLIVDEVNHFFHIIRGYLNMNRG